MVKRVNEDTTLAQHLNSSIGSVFFWLVMGVKNDRTIDESHSLADTTHCCNCICRIRGRMECGNLGRSRHFLDQTPRQAADASAVSIENQAN